MVTVKTASRTLSLTSRRLGLGTVALGGLGVLFLAGYFQQVYSAGGPRAVLDPESQAAHLAPALTRATEAFLKVPIEVTIDKQSLASTWAELGVKPDEAAIASEATRLAQLGTRPADVGDAYFAKAQQPVFVPVLVDRSQGMAALLDLKNRYDRDPVGIKMDLDNRRVFPEEPGFGVNVYESLAAVETRSRMGEQAIQLVGAALRPATDSSPLKDIDISHVLGSFETLYPPGEKDRNYNLALGAEKVNGFVLMPGQEFSFNDVVGNRTEKEGYHVAHVILAGEMVDGMAGGSCQISSTLHGAAYFAGLDIVKSQPHSRPSAYITMGLDATVVYPQVDLQLRNPYDFPVVLKYTVSQGTMRVEVLGKKRPYKRVRFERQVLQEFPYKTVTREDDKLPLGATVVDQIGFPGYLLERRRIFYEGDKVAKRERRKIKYPATTEYVRVGINPDPSLPLPPKAVMHGLKPPKQKLFHLDQ